MNVKAELLLEHLTEEVEILKRGLLSLGARIEEPAWLALITSTAPA